MALRLWQHPAVGRGGRVCCARHHLAYECDVNEQRSRIGVRARRVISRNSIDLRTRELCKASIILHRLFDWVSVAERNADDLLTYFKPRPLLTDRQLGLSSHTTCDHESYNGR